MYGLWSDYYSKFSWYPSPHTVTKFFLMMRKIAEYLRRLATVSKSREQKVGGVDLAPPLTCSVTLSTLIFSSLSVSTYQATVLL